MGYTFQTTAGQIFDMLSLNTAFTPWLWIEKRERDVLYVKSIKLHKRG